MVARINTFDDWIDLFRDWRGDIGLDPRVADGYQFEAKFDELESPEIQFGAYAGDPKWERLRDVPDQRIKDALHNYIVYQGDTEFASVEQQRTLLATAPSDYDLRAISRIMTEEMRHGWQMTYLLVNYFGSSGRLEAEKLMQRRAYNKNRLLGAFNVDVNDWLDFLVYTEFQDRDGKFQLKMLSRSAFAPLARSMGPMLKEESFHLGTGHSGLKRVLKAGQVPPAVLQKYFYKWVPACYDLFGSDNSSSAQWAYVWGVKGRYDEDPRRPADKTKLNESARDLYLHECGRLVADLNRLIPDESQHLRLPSLRFNRRIGTYANRPHDVYGNALDEADWRGYLASVTPGPAEGALLAPIFAGRQWIEAHGPVNSSQ